MKAMIWERESKLCAWEGLEGGKEREQWYNYISISKNKK